MIDLQIHEAIERAAGAGDPRIASLSINSPSIVSTDRLNQALQVIKRFCENVPPDATASEILEAIDDMDGRIE